MRRLQGGEACSCLARGGEEAGAAGAAPARPGARRGPGPGTAAPAQDPPRPRRRIRPPGAATPAEVRQVPWRRLWPPRGCGRPRPYGAARACLEGFHPGGSGVGWAMGRRRRPGGTPPGRPAPSRAAASATHTHSSQRKAAGVRVARPGPPGNGPAGQVAGRGASVPGEAEVSVAVQQESQGPVRQPVQGTTARTRPADKSSSRSGIRVGRGQGGLEMLPGLPGGEGSSARRSSRIPSRWRRQGLAVRGDEPEALFSVEPLHDAFCHGATCEKNARSGKGILARSASRNSAQAWFRNPWAR